AEDRELVYCTGRCDAGPIDFLHLGIDQLLRRLEVRLRDREGEVRVARTADVLHDDVNRDPGRAQRLEDACGNARAVAHSDHGDLRDVRLLRDAAHALALFHRAAGDDPRTDAVPKASTGVASL